MHPLPQQIQKLELFFDEIHDYLCELEGNNAEISMTALKGSLYCRSLLCDLLNEQSGDE